MLHTYEAEIYVNNIRTKESVSANDTTSAKKLIEARYPGSKIRWARLPRRVDWLKSTSYINTWSLIKLSNFMLLTLIGVKILCKCFFTIEND